jgi:hypothetical protein
MSPAHATQLRVARLSLCAISQEPLAGPPPPQSTEQTPNRVVADLLGNLFLRSSVLELLAGCLVNQAAVRRQFPHLRGASDFFELKPTLSTSSSSSSASPCRVQCAITGLEPAACSSPFFALRLCGHMLSSSALSTTSSCAMAPGLLACPVCGVGYSAHDCIKLAPSVEEAAEMFAAQYAAMRKGKAAGRPPGRKARLGLNGDETEDHGLAGRARELSRKRSVGDSGASASESAHQTGLGGAMESVCPATGGALKKSRTQDCASSSSAAAAVSSSSSSSVSSSSAAAVAAAAAAPKRATDRPAGRHTDKAAPVLKAPTNLAVLRAREAQVAIASHVVICATGSVHSHCRQKTGCLVYSARSPIMINRIEGACHISSCAVICM